MLRKLALVLKEQGEENEAGEILVVGLLHFTQYLSMRSD